MTAAVGEEVRVLVPNDNPEGLEAVGDVYAKLERFFTAVVQFEAK
jgi:hypothetical protein